MYSQNADLIKEDETLEDLQLSGLQVIQKRDGFRFGIDAVLLSDFAKDFRAEEMLDMCTGSGVIPVLLSAKTKTPKIFGLEIQEEVFEMAKRTVRLNNLSDRVFIDKGDVKALQKQHGHQGQHRTDAVDCVHSTLHGLRQPEGPADGIYLDRRDAQAEGEADDIEQSRIGKGFRVLIYSRWSSPRKLRGSSSPRVRVS